MVPPHASLLSLSLSLCFACSLFLCRSINLSLLMPFSICFRFSLLFIFCSLFSPVSLSLKYESHPDFSCVYVYFFFYFDFLHSFTCLSFSCSLSWTYTALLARLLLHFCAYRTVCLHSILPSPASVFIFVSQVPFLLLNNISLSSSLPHNFSIVVFAHRHVKFPSSYSTRQSSLDPFCVIALSLTRVPQLIIWWWHRYHIANHKYLDDLKT